MSNTKTYLIDAYKERNIDPSLIDMKTIDYKEFNQDPFSEPSEEFKNYLDAIAISKSISEAEMDLEEVEKIQKRLLYLNELQKKEHKKLFDRIVTTSIHKGFESYTSVAINKELVSLLNQNDLLNIYQKSSSEIEKDPEFRATIMDSVDRRISSTEIKSDLIASGYSDTAIEKIISNDEISEKLKLAKNYVLDIEMQGKSDAEKNLAVTETFTKNKSSVMAVLQSPNTKVLLSAVGLTMACASGGVLPIAMAAPRLIAAMGESKAVSNILTGVSNKFIEVGDKVGIDFRGAVDFTKEIAETSKKIVDSKWFKGVAILSIACGVGALLSSPEKLKDISDSLTAFKDDFGKGASKLIDHIVGNPDATSSALKQAADLNQADILSVVESPIKSIIVKSGDTLSEIVKSTYASEGIKLTGSQVTDVIKSLDISNPNLIKVGQVIDLPSADSLSGITKGIAEIGKSSLNIVDSAKDAVGVVADGVADKYNLPYVSGEVPVSSKSSIFDSFKSAMDSIGSVANSISDKFNATIEYIGNIPNSENFTIGRSGPAGAVIKVLVEDSIDAINPVIDKVLGNYLDLDQTGIDGIKAGFGATAVSVVIGTGMKNTYQDSVERKSKVNDVKNDLMEIYGSDSFNKKLEKEINHMFTNKKNEFEVAQFAIEYITKQPAKEKDVLLLGAKFKESFEKSLTKIVEDPSIISEKSTENKKQYEANAFDR